MHDRNKCLSAADKSKYPQNIVIMLHLNWHANKNVVECLSLCTLLNILVINFYAFTSFKKQIWDRWDTDFD